MAFKKSKLDEQTRADKARFDNMKPSAKNALVSELKKFWPIADDVWPEKFLYEDGESAGDVATTKGSCQPE